jgi:hypothetical protein
LYISACVNIDAAKIKNLEVGSGSVLLKSSLFRDATKISSSRHCAGKQLAYKK